MRHTLKDYRTSLMANLNKATLLLIYIFLSLASATAREINVKHTHYSTENGLTSNAISDIEKDNKGFIWISTWNGLCRFDGFNFQKYATGQMSGIPFLHNRILDIYPDREGNIWLRMYDNRVFVLNRHTDCIMNAFTYIKGGENFRSARKLTVSKDGYVYAHIERKGIYQLRLHNGILSQRLFKTHNYEIRNIIADDCHRVWLNSQSGLLVLNTRNGTISKIKQLQGDVVTSIFKHDDKILIGGRNGEIDIIKEHYPNRINKIVKLNLHNDNITSINIDKEGLIWYTTNTPGVSYYNPRNKKQRKFQQIVPAPEADMHGATLFEYGNILWIRMNHGGFGYYDRENDEINYFHNNPDNSWDLSNTVATYTALPEGVIFMSTNRRGLEKLELLNKRIDHGYIVKGSNEFGVNETRAIFWDRLDHQLFIGNKKGNVYCNNKIAFSTGGRIYGMMQDRTGLLWVCDKDKGLFTYNIKKKKLNHIPLINKNAYQSIEDDNGIIWVATYGNGVMGIKNNKLIKVEGQKYNIYNKVRTLCKAKDGRIWAGTTDGIIIISRRNNKYIVEPIKQTQQLQYQLAANDIIQIRCDKKGTMWIATNGGGLSKSITRDSLGNVLMKKDRYAFHNFGEKDGLPSDEIRSITFDRKGNVWFSSDQSICSYDPVKGFFTTFSMQDGVGDVACSEAAAITLPDDRMLFGTLNGYYIVDVNKLRAFNGNLFRLAITDFYINDQLMSPRLNNTYNYYIPDSNAVELPSRSSVFSIRFASLNYQLQHRVHYQYMLEGYDKEWKNADISRMVSYSNIPAGSYRFKVKAFLLESPDKYDEKTLTIIVPPFILLSAGALWTYAFIIIIGGLTFYYLEKRKRERRMEKMRVLKIGPQEIAFKEKDDYQFVKARLDWLENNYSNSRLKIDDMVHGSKLSRTGFYNQLKELTGLGPKEFISDFRLKKACMYLENDDCTVAEVAYRTGFNDPVYFTRLFRQKMGITPSAYRDDAQKNNHIKE